MPTDLEWHHGLRHDRRWRDVAEPWGALQWDIRRRGRLSHPEVQQSPAVGSRAERFDPVEHRNQRERAVRSRMGFNFEFPARLRSYFPEIRHRSPPGVQDPRLTPPNPNFAAAPKP